VDGSGGSPGGGLVSAYEDLPDLNPSDDLKTVRTGLQVLGGHYALHPERDAALYALDRLEELLGELRDVTVDVLETQSGLGIEDLIIEYRRLYAIEDASKELLVARLRDEPEEAMAALWSSLAKALDKDSRMRP
jgi:hypothetical protein